MFPNPQSALPFPPRPNLERYRKIAKDLVTACKSGGPEAVRAWAKGWVDALFKLSGVIITPQLPVRIQRSIEDVADFARRKLFGDEQNAGTCTLAAAQFVIARSHGFGSWPKFVAHLRALEVENSSVSRFEAAADAIVSGDAATLNRLLREDPELIRQRSLREHGASLLHYVSANGVEGYRQRTPDNIVEIAEILLDAGAEVDRTANVYGGGCTTLGLAATSLHPELAGVQQALLETLLAYGARLDFAGAAGLGLLDAVKTRFTDDRANLNEAFLYACRYGRDPVVEFLLDRGADLAASSQTALHWAVIGGHLSTVKMLVSRQAPLELENAYGGSAWGQTLWSAAHGGDPDLYIAILETLRAAGAKIPERHVPVNKTVDDWLEQHGSQAEPSWHWYGEKREAD
jgi:hypothetical protein